MTVGCSTRTCSSWERAVGRRGRGDLDQRAAVTAVSAIRSAGEAILVDYRPLSPPYRISAIGDPDTLQTRFSDGPGGETCST